MTPFVFQTDSEIIKKVYQKNPNYLIEFSDREYQKNCTIYFCSNDIYYPNNEDIFRKRIIEGNLFEWFGTRIQKSNKHIFVRDICKQWYLSGINSNINSPHKLFEFLQRETMGYKVITMGSSAGGYAAILYGCLLKAEHVIAFNPQFELNSLLKNSCEDIDPLIFRLQNTPISKYYDLHDLINDSPTDIFYFYSNKSHWDIEQFDHVRDIKGIHHISFSTKHHGIPFLKVCLPKVINMDKSALLRLSQKSHHPLFFSVKMVGLFKVFRGFIVQIYKAYKKRK